MKLRPWRANGSSNRENHLINAALVPPPPVQSSARLLVEPFHIRSQYWPGERRALSVREKEMFRRYKHSLYPLRERSKIRVRHQY